MAKHHLGLRNGQFEKTELPGGIRVLSELMPGIRSVSVGIWIDAGSRNETEADNGICHFIEHLLFKGTKRRSAKELASALESLGGSLNGFTSREQTCFHCRVMDEHLPTALDVLADLSCNSLLAPAHVGREKQVICEEIKEAEDNPSDRIHDLFSEVFWGNHPLGRPIMGTQDTIKGMTRSRVLDFKQRHYRTGSVVVAAAGGVSHKELVSLAKRYLHFGRGTAEAPLTAVPPPGRRFRVEQIKNQQTHLCLGFTGPAYNSPDRMTALALSTHLGGGMSSVLFQKIREDKGLAYSVYTFNDFYRDTGIFGAYVGTDARHVKQAGGMVVKEMKNLRRKKLTSRQMDQLRRQMQGQLILGLESSTSRMNRIARMELMMGRFQSLSQTLKDIEKVSASGLLAMANEVFDQSHMAAAALGPIPASTLTDVF